VRLEGPVPERTPVEYFFPGSDYDNCPRYPVFTDFLFYNRGNGGKLFFAKMGRRAGCMCIGKRHDDEIDEYQT
jgi:hypothetical protein